MSWLILMFFGVVGLGAGYLAGYAMAVLKLGRYKAMADAATELEKNFKLAAGEALQRNNQAFLDLATQNLGRYQAEAKGDLDKKQQAFAELVKPISEALKKTEEQIREIEKERRESFGSISAQLKLMGEGQQQLQAETRNLVTALRRPEVRGRWGELTLKRLAELAGMVDRCDFLEQVHTDTGEGALRPDMLIRLPDNRELVVDAKTSLDSYLAAIEAADAQLRETHLASHARKVRERIKELAGKRYWDQFKQSPDFVILFIPGDQFLSAALDREPMLIEEALRQKVMLATPTSFVALLKAVAYGWRQVALAENAERIREHAETLHQRIATFAEHMGKIGGALENSVQHFNNAVGSLERQVLPAARRFTELGVQSKKEMPELEPVETAARLTEAKKPDA
ncbi:MAG TPA: DNA recombination protein RmuC [Gammaproteobacteria bacterium]|nr:DNA recombination protein RmuC [Gammaproteobacteria bacterium]